MKTIMYSIKDTKVGFAQPFVMHNEQEAIRAFKGLIREEGSNLHKWPQDYELWQVAEWDDAQGLVTSAGPKYIMGGMEGMTKK